jgi:hypothetical protein
LERPDDGSFGPLQSRDRLPTQLQQRPDTRAHRVSVRQDLKTKFTDTDSKWVEMILDEMSLHGEERDREAARANR